MASNAQFVRTGLDESVRNLSPDVTSGKHREIANFGFNSRKQHAVWDDLKIRLSQLTHEVCCIGGRIPTSVSKGKDFPKFETTEP